VDEPASSLVLTTAEAARRGIGQVGGKASVLARLAVEGFPVPAGFVVPVEAFDGDGLVAGAGAAVLGAARASGGERFAVRSSAVAEDGPDASFAGLYDSLLDVSTEDVPAAVVACWRSHRSDRVAAYAAGRRRPGHDVPAVAGPGMAVLVQHLVRATVAGVAFTADPLTGDRDVTVVTGVAGLADDLVAGRVDGEQWTVRDGVARPAPLPGADRPRAGRPATVLDAGQVGRVARLARDVERALGGPQDVEWACAPDGTVHLLQARPMTALPERVDWTPPAPGHWMRTFRLGEWLPDPMTPLFADWLLPALEAGYAAGMRDSTGVAVPFRTAAIHGWYYTAPPAMDPWAVLRLLARGRRRLVRVLVNGLVVARRDPARADRSVLRELADEWREGLLPRYRSAVEAATADLDAAGLDAAAGPAASPAELVGVVAELADLAGRYLWSLAIVGGSAWKMEAALATAVRRQLPGLPPGTAQLLLSGLSGVDRTTPPHAVLSLDWYHPVQAELGVPAGPPPVGTRAAARREEAEELCRRALHGRPRTARRFDALLAATRRYAVLREQQARDLTLAWPCLRRAALRLGEQLRAAGALDAADDVFFLARAELDGALAARPDGPAADLRPLVRRRREEWERQRRLPAPLSVGAGQRLAERVVAAAVAAARGGVAAPTDGITGHPAGPGRATGPVRLVTGPADFAALRDGDVLVAAATTPAWTPLFGRASAVVTDAGSLAAHASLIAREYGIPAVVGTGNATRRLRSGQVVTVDGTAGVVHTRAQAPVGPAERDGPGHPRREPGRESGA